MTYFILIVAVLFIVLMSLLWYNKPQERKKTYRTVKAGQVNLAYVYPATIDKKDILKNKRFAVNDTLINPDDYEIFIVNGNSMSGENIKDGDGVLVKRLYGNEKYGIKDTPVLIFEIDLNKDNIRNNISPVEFKLRKFITYVNCENTFDEWFETIAERFPDLHESKETIAEKFKKCVEKYRDNNNADKIQLIMSSTLNTDTGALQYSFHPIKFLYGQVNYVIPSKIFE